MRWTGGDGLGHPAINDNAARRRFQFQPGNEFPLRGTSCKLSGTVHSSDQSELQTLLDCPQPRSGQSCLDLGGNHRTVGPALGAGVDGLDDQTHLLETGPVDFADLLSDNGVNF